MSPIRDLKAEWDRKVPFLQSKVSKMYSESAKDYNPFLDKNGNIFNKYIDYQSLLDNPNVASKTKQFIMEATKLQPTKIETTPVTPTTADPNTSGTTPNTTNTTNTTNTSPKPTNTNSKSTTVTPAGSGAYENFVGQRITDTSKFNNDAAKGQCVWYVRGRAAEKLGVDPGALGHAKDVWYNAPSDKKVSATADNLRPNMIVSYASGPGTAAQYGHVIYIEDVVGDTVYYTEGGSTYYNKGTDGVVKTATRDGILNGKNNNGGTIGANVVGFIDLSKY